MANEVNIYTPRYLAEVVRQAPPVHTFFRDTFFTNVKKSTTERVDIDLVKGDRRMAAFVHPRVGGKVLKASGMKTLPGAGGMSKGFLVKFSSGHVGMVQRRIGSKSSHTRTAKGYKRWTNAKGNVEKLVTMGSPSATAMHHTIWPEVEPSVEEYLQERLQAQVERVLARAGKK